MASYSFNKLALLEILGILGWSKLQWSDWLIWTFAKKYEKKSGVKQSEYRAIKKLLTKMFEHLNYKELNIWFIAFMLSLESIFHFGGLLNDPLHCGFVGLINQLNSIMTISQEMYWHLEPWFTFKQAFYSARISNSVWQFYMNLVDT